MAADYTFDYILAVDNTGTPVKSATFTLYAAASGGSASPMYDMNGSPISSVSSSADGVCPRFRADITKGYLDNGSIRLPIASTAVMDSLAAAQAAQSSAAAAVTSASNASSSAATAATQAANSATAANQSAQVALAQPGVPVLQYNETTGVLPDRRTLTTDRTKAVFVRVPVSAYPSITTAPISTSGTGLALPVTDLDPFIVY